MKVKRIGHSKYKTPARRISKVPEAVQVVAVAGIEEIGYTELDIKGELPKQDLAFGLGA